jgi:hypothetical protein
LESSHTREYDTLDRQQIEVRDEMVIEGQIANKLTVASSKSVGDVIQLKE